jgi:GT2 family glycosyltransferase
MLDPIVTAIVSTYRSERFLRGCLEDLVNQTLFERIEVLVIDSASPENEGAIVRDFQKRFPAQIRYVRTDHRETLYAAWNRGIGLARGRYITNANTDDRHSPMALERLCDALEENPEVMLAYAHCFTGKIPNQTFGECSSKHVQHYPKYFPPLCLLHSFFGPQPLWRREVHERIGMFDPEFFAVGDSDFNIRFCLKGLQAMLVPEVLGLFLEHEDSISSSYSRQSQEKAQVMAKYRCPEHVLALYAAAGWNLEGKWVKAAALYDLAIRAMSFRKPWRKKNDAEPEFALACLIAALEHAPGTGVLLERVKTLRSSGIDRATLNAEIMKVLPFKTPVSLGLEYHPFKTCMDNG